MIIHIAYKLICYHGPAYPGKRVCTVFSFRIYHRISGRKPVVFNAVNFLIRHFMMIRNYNTHTQWLCKGSFGSCGDPVITRYYKLDSVIICGSYNILINAVTVSYPLGESDIYYSSGSTYTFFQYIWRTYAVDIVISDYSYRHLSFYRIRKNRSGRFHIFHKGGIMHFGNVSVKKHINLLIGNSSPVSDDPCQIRTDSKIPGYFIVIGALSHHDPLFIAHTVTYYIIYSSSWNKEPARAGSLFHVNT